MTLPIEFTTTVKVDQLIGYQRKARLLQTLKLFIFIIPLAILILWLSKTADNEAFSLAVYIVPILLFLAIWLVMIYFLNSRTVKKQFETNPSLGAVSAYVITLDTISNFSELSNGELSWKLVRKVEMTDQYITLRLQNGSFYMIDPNDLEKEQLEDLKALFIEKGFLN